MGVWCDFDVAKALKSYAHVFKFSAKFVNLSGNPCRKASVCVKNGFIAYDELYAIADGMNLVAKEGPIVNQRNGVLILSERAGARQQLEAGATVISPCDVYATSEALHQALTMPEDERAQLQARLKWIIEREDIQDWLCRQLATVKELNL